MSYRRGIARLYIIAAVLWVSWSVYRSFPQATQEAAALQRDANAQLKDASVAMDDCNRAKHEAEAAGFGSADPEDRCGKLYQSGAAVAYAMMARTPHDIWRANIKYTAATCLLPPVGGALLLAALFWAVRGFGAKL